MSDYCTIGPVTVTNAHLYDNNSIEVGGTESFTIIATNRQARQIMGLSDINSDKEYYGNIAMVKGDSSWGVVWIDTSSALTDNDYISHKGWYKITSAEPTTDLGANYVHLQVTAEKLSNNEYEYLEMDYTPGVNDGTLIDHGYSDTVPVYSLNEDFSDFDTTDVWYPAATPSNMTMTTPSMTSDGNVLTATGGSSVDGSMGVLYTQAKSTFNTPFTWEVNINAPSTPATGNSQHAMGMIMSPSRITPGASLNWRDTFSFIYESYTSTYKYYSLTTDINGATKWYIPSTATTTTPSIMVKVAVEDTGYIRISLDEGSGYVDKYYGPHNLSSYEPLYLGLLLYNLDSTSGSMKSDSFQVYNMGEQTYNNVVSLPATTPITSADFSRYSADGNIPCYTNPSFPLYFWQDSSNFYSGCVKGYNSNYANSTPQLITSTDEVLSPSKFYVTNGLIKLTTGATATTPILFSAYASPAGWTDLQIISPGTINLLKPLYISPERQTYQINDTKWTINRGKYHVKVEHPYTGLDYTKRSYYVHDSTTTTTPADDADISMTTQYYCNIYSADADVTRFQIIQTEPVTIKSDNIPAADITGLGWYDNSESSSSNNYYSNLAKEFMKQTNQKINMRRV